MAQPVLEYFIGSPIAWAGPYPVINAVVDGNVQSATTTRVVMEYYGQKVVLRGSFELDAGGQVLSGTVTGFDGFIGETRTLKGSGYNIAFNDLKSADYEKVGSLLLDNVTQKGTDGADYLFAWDDNATLLGRGGDDWLYGWEGNDRIKGGDGNDFISGGPGRDTLWGGAGRDVFSFGAYLDETDKVKDFQAGKDTIGLDLQYFGPLGGGYLNKKEFTVGKNASADRAQVIYDKKTGMLYYDEDGLGVAPKVAICELAPKLDLKASNIFVGIWD